MLGVLVSAARALRKETFVHHAITLGGGTGIGQLIVAASYPVITRLYGPSTLGIYGLIVSFAFLASTALGGKYELAIVSASSEREATWLTLVSLLTTIVVSILAAALLQILVEENILSYGNVPDWASLMLLPILLLTGWFTALRFWCVRQAQFSRVSRALIAQGFGRAIAPVTLGLASASVGSLFAGELVGRLFAVRGLFSSFRPRLRSVSDEPWIPQLRKVMRLYWRCPAILLPSTLVDAIGAWLPLPIIASLFGPVAAGEFALVQRVVSLPAAFITSSVADVVHSHASTAHNKGFLELRVEMVRATKRLIFLSILVYLPLGLLSPFTFGPLFGAKWAQAGVLASCLAPFLAVQTVVGPLTRVFLIVRRYRLKLICDVLTCFLPFSAIVLFHSKGLEATVAAYGVTAALTGVGVFIMLYNIGNLETGAIDSNAGSVGGGGAA